MKFDIWRVIELGALLIFGFVKYLHEIYLWTNDTKDTIIFAILFFVGLFMIASIYKIIYDFIKKLKHGKSKRGGRKNA